MIVGNIIYRYDLSTLHHPELMILIPNFFNQNRFIIAQVDRFYYITFENIENK